MLIENYDPRKYEIAGLIFKEILNEFIQVIHS